ncbi:lipocalin family protein [Chitinophaga agrisoli]|uniref:Lipocalin family protein n=1 Tax=Chitinophaga agrisoli TaxID=2607653 RepID=A0A5B2VYW5_9BACT|nr:lipocalin family protein [Chitinophaga agrisoli]KAA2245053.1 lipocalin family protein [Chitinophaga agrisoli]
MQKSIVRLLALAGVFTLLFIACSKDDDTPPENKMIQGNWQFDFSIDTVFNPQNAVVSIDTTTSADVSGAYFNLKADGKFEANLSDTVVTGTYRLINGQTLELTNNQGISDQVPVITLTDTQMVFMVRDNDYGNGNYSKEYFHLKK